MDSHFCSFRSVRYSIWQGVRRVRAPSVSARRSTRKASSDAPYARRLLCVGSRRVGLGPPSFAVQRLEAPVSGCNGRQRASLLTQTSSRHPKRVSHDPPRVFLLTVRVFLLSFWVFLLTPRLSRYRKRSTRDPPKVSFLSFRVFLLTLSLSRHPKRSSRHRKRLKRTRRTTAYPARRPAQHVHSPHKHPQGGQGASKRPRIHPGAARHPARAAPAAQPLRPSSAHPWHHAPIPLL